MSNRRRLNLSALPHWFRQRSETLPDDIRDLRDGFRADPVSVLNHPVVRILALLVLGAAVLLTLGWLVGRLTPAADSGQFSEATPTATLYVACTNPDCLESDTVKVPMDFHDWPMTCPQCGQRTVYRAQLCPTCRHWYAVAPGQPDVCPFCAKRERAQQPEGPSRPRIRTGDDAEDPW